VSVCVCVRVLIDCASRRVDDVRSPDCDMCVCVCVRVLIDCASCRVVSMTLGRRLDLVLTHWSRST